jgi:hypothetical protein
MPQKGLPCHRRTFHAQKGQRRHPLAPAFEAKISVSNARPLDKSQIFISASGILIKVKSVFRIYSRVGVRGRFHPRGGRGDGKVPHLYGGQSLAAVWHFCPGRKLLCASSDTAQRRPRTAGNPGISRLPVYEVIRSHLARSLLKYSYVFNAIGFAVLPPLL